MKARENLPSVQSENRSLSDPFGMLHSEIDRIFSDFSRGFGLPRGFWDEGMRMPRLWGGNGGVMPSLDMHDAGDKVAISAELPGVDEKDIDISVEDDVLTISGEKKSEVEHKDGDNYRSERSYGRFSRSVSLPFKIDAGKVDARFDKGVLKLMIQKPVEAQQQVKKIAIKH